MDKLKQGSKDEILSHKVEHGLTKFDLRSLERSQWLNDPVISGYMMLLVERSQYEKSLPRVHMINAIRTHMFMRGNFAPGPQTPDNMFEYDYILCPFTIGPTPDVIDHWILMVIDVAGSKIHCFDSMDGLGKHPRRPHHACLKALLAYIHDQNFRHGKNIVEFTEVDHRDIPFQVGGTDCGVFVCMYAEHFTRRAPFLFSQTDVPHWRMRIAYELATGRLMA